MRHHRPWFDPTAFGQEDLPPDLLEPVRRGEEALREGARVFDEARLTARERIPFYQRPQATLLATTAVAGAIGGAIGRPVVGALVGAALGYFAHKAWLEPS